MFRGAGLPAIRRDCSSDYSAEGRMRRRNFSRTSGSFCISRKQSHAKNGSRLIGQSWHVEKTCRETIKQNISASEKFRATWNKLFED